MTAPDHTSPSREVTPQARRNVPQSRPRGRRRGGPDTRATIVEAARSLFIESGVTATSRRSVARAADCDPALVRYYFPTKVDLLLAVAELGFDPRVIVPAAIGTGKRGRGHRVVATVLTVWESPIGRDMLELLHGRPEIFRQVASVLAEQITREFLAVTTSGPQHAAYRVAQSEAVIGGMIMTRYVARMEPIASMRRDEVVRWFGPMIDDIITDRAPK